MKFGMRILSLSSSVLMASVVADSLGASSLAAPPPQSLTVQPSLSATQVSLLLQTRPVPVYPQAGSARRAVRRTTRRTTRRVIRRSTIYLRTLPVGYTTVVVEGVSLYFYQGTYYQRYNNQYVVVYID